MSDAQTFEPDTRPLFARLRAEFGASPTIREGAAATVDQATLRADAALVRRVVDAIPNTSALFGTRESYRDVGYAIKAALGTTPEAYDLFWSWCARWEGGVNDPGVVEADWRRMKPPFRRGWRWLAELAHQHGGGAFDLGEVWFEPQSEPLFPADPTSAARRLALQAFNNAAEGYAEGAEPLVEQLLDQGAMSVLYGESNSGKTFVGLALAYAIAAGVSFGRLPTRRGAVVYVSSEGGRAVRRRLAALKRKHGPVDGFFVLPETVDLFQHDADTRPLIEAVAALGVPVVFIAIDTLARAMAGGDENSTKDMSAFVKNIDRVRAATGAHVMLVHHSGKDASRGARGSSALRAATDTEIEVTPGRFAVTKQRDMDGSFAIGFELEVVELGQDARTRPVTSCTVRLIDDVTGKAPAGVARKLAEVLDALASFTNGASAGEVRDVMIERGGKPSADAVRSALKRLEIDGRVCRPTRGQWRVNERQGTAAPAFQVPAGGFFD